MGKLSKSIARTALLGLEQTKAAEGCGKTKVPVLYFCLLEGKTTQEFIAAQECGEKGKYFYKDLQKRLIT